MKTITTTMPNGRKFTQQVRGICQVDILNPCWDDRDDDVVGQHWSGLGPACPACTKAAKHAAKVRAATFSVSDEMRAEARQLGLSARD